MKEFGAGDLSQRVDVQTSDEIGQIGVEYNDMAKNIENLVNKVYLMELSQKEAEIEFLKMQINPHFLYNTLDTISWMSIMNGNEEVAEVSVSLAELLRANVKNDSFVTISDEIKTVKNYLSIQQHRFGDRIKVIYDIDSDIGDYYIPFFILQPLIENAIIHGLEPKVGEGFIKITVTKQNDDIFFSVFDDGVGMSQEEINAIYAGFEDDSVKKIGINNVYRRLTLRYGKQCGFQITSYPGAGTEIIFKLPINKMKNNKEVNQDEQ
jgi:two-component system sensor histidine kinase YesM